MKLVNYISICGIALCMLSACESDLEKTIYDEGTVKPAVLQEIASSYTLEAEKADELAVTMTWSKPDVGYKASVTNSLEIALAGKGFAQSTVLSSDNDKTTTDLTVLALNKAVLKLLNNVIPAEPVDVELRISSSISNAATPFTSNVVKTRITPYSMEKEYPFIGVRGSYNGWGWPTVQKVYSKDENHDYAGMIYFGRGKAAEGWKFCGDENWSVDNWGTGGAVASEAPEVVLTNSGGNNIAAYAKTSYFVTFNNETGVLKMAKGHNSWGVNIQGSTATDQELVFVETPVHVLTATIELKAGDKWRIRPDNNDQDAIIPADLEHALAVEGDYFKAEEAGTYVVTWKFNRVNPQLMVQKSVD